MLPITIKERTYDSRWSMTIDLDYIIAVVGKKEIDNTGRKYTPLKISQAYKILDLIVDLADAGTIKKVMSRLQNLSESEKNATKLMEYYDRILIRRLTPGGELYDI